MLVAAERERSGGVVETGAVQFREEHVGAEGAAGCVSSSTVVCELLLCFLAGVRRLRRGLKDKPSRTRRSLPVQ